MTFLTNKGSQRLSQGGLHTAWWKRKAWGQGEVYSQITKRKNGRQPPIVLTHQHWSRRSSKQTQGQTQVARNTQGKELPGSRFLVCTRRVKFMQTSQDGYED